MLTVHTILSITAVIGGGMAVLLSITSLATPNWTEVSIGHSGLWQICDDFFVGYCENYGISGLPVWFHAVRVLMILGVLAYICVVGLCIFRFYTNHDKHIRLLAFFTVFGVLCMMVSCSVYGIESSADDTYGYSFILAVSAAGAGLLVISILAAQRWTTPATKNITSYDMQTRL